jgi:hypothetical protein
MGLLQLTHFENTSREVSIVCTRLQRRMFAVKVVEVHK